VTPTASLLAALSRPLPPPDAAPAGLRPYRRSLAPAEAVRCRCAGLLGGALTGSGPSERAILAAAAESLHALVTAHAMTAWESGASRAAASRAHSAVALLPANNRAPVLVAMVRALLVDAPDVMLPLDRAVRDAAKWRGCAPTAEHEATAAEILEREVRL
jgi:hypothetical protein